MARGKPKTRVGVVSSAKMDKTVTVNVVRIVEHKAYKKRIKRTYRIKAHDEKNECVVGDKVLIIESSPISKTKSWRVSKIIERARGAGLQSPDELFAEGGTEA